MNLKNNYLLKTVEVANKKCKNFNIYNFILKKNKERKTPGYSSRYHHDIQHLVIIILHLCTKNLDKIYNSWDIEHDRLKLVIIGHSLPFYPSPLLKTWKIRILKKWKKLLEISSFYMLTKNHNHMRYGSWDTEWDTEYFVILGQFFP